MSFGDLYDYFNKDFIDREFIISQNLTYGNAKAEIIGQFEDNAKLLKFRKNQNYLYHEILSLPEIEDKTLDIKTQKRMLEDLAYNYIEKRCTNNLVYGVIHEDKGHLHAHLMISSNELGKNINLRLERAKFNEIRKEVEIYKEQKFKVLGRRKLYNREYKKNRQKNRKQ